MIVTIKMKKNEDKYLINNEKTNTNIVLDNNTINAEQILQILNFDINNKYVFEIDNTIDKTQEPVLIFEDFFTKLLNEINNISNN